MRLQLCCMCDVDVEAATLSPATSQRQLTVAAGRLSHSILVCEPHATQERRALGWRGGRSHGGGGGAKKRRGAEEAGRKVPRRGAKGAAKRRGRPSLPLRHSHQTFFLFSRSSSPLRTLLCSAFSISLSLPVLPPVPSLSPYHGTQCRLPTPAMQANVWPEGAVTRRAESCTQPRHDFMSLSLLLSFYFSLSPSRVLLSLYGNIQMFYVRRI